MAATANIAMRCLRHLPRQCTWRLQLRRGGDAAIPESGPCRATLESGLRLLALSRGGHLHASAVWQAHDRAHPDKGGDVRVFQPQALGDVDGTRTADTQDHVKRAGCHGQCSTWSRVCPPLGAIISQCTCSQAEVVPWAQRRRAFQKVRAELSRLPVPLGRQWDAAQCSDPQSIAMLVLYDANFVLLSDNCSWVQCIFRAVARSFLSQRSLERTVKLH